MKATKEEIVKWSQEYIADLLEISPDAVDPDADFDRLGVDSAIAVSLLSDIEDRYGIEVPPEALFEMPNLNAVAAYLQEQAQQGVA